MSALRLLRILPILFAAQTAVPVILLAIYARANKHASRDYSQLYKLFTPRLLLLMLATGLAEAAAIGPITTGIMRERHRLERSSGTKSTDANVRRITRALPDVAAVAGDAAPEQGLRFVAQRLSLDQPRLDRRGARSLGLHWRLGFDLVLA